MNQITVTTKVEGIEEFKIPPHLQNDKALSIIQSFLNNQLSQYGINGYYNILNRYPSGEKYLALIRR